MKQDVSAMNEEHEDVLDLLALSEGVPVSDTSRPETSSSVGVSL